MSAAAARKPTPREERHPDPLIGGMTFLEHLEEFRKRLIRALVAVLVGAGLAFLFIERIFNFIFDPTIASLPPGSKLIYTQPGETFALYIDIALMAGAVIAAPAIFYQVWRFVAPGLYAREKKLVLPFLALTTAGTVAGAAFSHFVVFPYMMLFFGTFSTPQLLFMPRVEDVFDLYLKMLGGMVAVFQMPTFAFFLARVGVLTWRLMWRNLRYAVLIIFIAAAVLTPSTDPWNQIVFAAPMLVLYLLSIGIAWLAAPRNA